MRSLILLIVLLLTGCKSYTSSVRVEINPSRPESATVVFEAKSL